MKESNFRNVVFCGDAVEVLSRFPDNHIDLTVFSPPYDNIRDYGNDWRFDYKSLGSSLFRVTKDGGICAMVIGDGTKNFAKSLTTFRLCVEWVDHCGWKLFECCIYKRDGRPGGWWNKRFRVDHEYILIFLKGEKPKSFDKSALMVKTKNNGFTVARLTDRMTNGKMKLSKGFTVKEKKCRGTLWEYATSNTEGNRTKLEHPATFPDRLAEDLISCFSIPGDLVLDPMCGSGTTCVIASKNNRDYLGIEINPKYHAIISKRMKNETDKMLI